MTLRSKEVTKSAAMLLFTLLTITACLNRESGVFIPLAALLLAWRCDRRLLRTALVALVCGVIVVVLVRVVQGDAVRVWTVDKVLVRNLLTLHESIPLVALTFGAFWWRLRHWRRAPEQVRALLPVVALYVLLVAAFGLWRELPRLLLPVAPLLMVLALYNLRNIGKSLNS